MYAPSSAASGNVVAPGEATGHVHYEPARPGAGLPAEVRIRRRSYGEPSAGRGAWDHHRPRHGRGRGRGRRRQVLRRHLVVLLDWVADLHVCVATGRWPKLPAFSGRRACESGFARPVRVSGVHRDGELFCVKADFGTWLSRCSTGSPPPAWPGRTAPPPTRTPSAGAPASGPPSPTSPRGHIPTHGTQVLGDRARLRHPHPAGRVAPRGIEGPGALLWELVRTVMLLLAFAVVCFVAVVRSYCVPPSAQSDHPRGCGPMSASPNAGS